MAKTRHIWSRQVAPSAFVQRDPSRGDIPFTEETFDPGTFARKLSYKKSAPQKGVLRGVMINRCMIYKVMKYKGQCKGKLAAYGYILESHISYLTRMLEKACS